MNFIETRGNDGIKPHEVTFSQAILSPMSSFGGLYIPKALPNLGIEFLQQHINSSYKFLAKSLLDAFKVDISDDILQEALNKYDYFDDSNNPVPLTKIKDGLYISELWHGPTRAFKDMALQPFGVILSKLAKQADKKYLILAATSGDTGPAALDAFKNCSNIQVVCLYPNGGTSDVQRLQMITESGDNLSVIGINGDFDYAQNSLKKLLTSTNFNKILNEKNINLSAANSVNFGRIIFQIVYHIYSYLELVRQKEISLGEKIYLDVPSGNFGNALGGYYAMKMGLPIEKILIASNNNNVLTKFIKGGVYNLNNLKVTPTTSPAMDILKSSNIERILFDLFGAKRTKQLMLELEQNHFYKLTSKELIQLQTVFSADFCSDLEGSEYIKQTFKSGYLMDPHTATCLKSYDTQRKNVKCKTIAYSTAEWTKFSPVIAEALIGSVDLNDQKALLKVSSLGDKITIPKQINKLFKLPITQPLVINKEKIEHTILKLLN